MNIALLLASSAVQTGQTIARFPVQPGAIRGTQPAATQNYRTKEFHGQLKRDVFGSISLTAMF